MSIYIGLLMCHLARTRVRAERTTEQEDVRLRTVELIMNPSTALENAETYRRSK
jgi:hypothetical protein